MKQLRCFLTTICTPRGSQSPVTGRLRTLFLGLHGCVEQLVRLNAQRSANLRFPNSIGGELPQQSEAWPGLDALHAKRRELCADSRL